MLNVDIESKGNINILQDSYEESIEENIKVNNFISNKNGVESRINHVESAATVSKSSTSDEISKLVLILKFIFQTFIRISSIPFTNFGLIFFRRLIN